MSDANADGNGRVTMALLGQKMDNLILAVNEIKRSCELKDNRINALERGQTQRETQIGDLRKDVDALEGKSESWSIINSIGVAVAGLMAAIGITK